MRRVWLVLSVTLCGLVAPWLIGAGAGASAVAVAAARTGASAVAVAAAGTGVAPRAALTSVCSPGARSLTVTATMRPVTGTRKLNVKFLLQAKPAHTNLFEPVATAGLGRWLAPTSPPTLGQNPGDVWNVRQPVAHLAKGDKYRFRVGFRWLGKKGKVLKREWLLSKTCAI